MTLASQDCTQKLRILAFKLRDLALHLHDLALHPRLASFKLPFKLSVLHLQLRLARWVLPLKFRQLGFIPAACLPAVLICTGTE